MPKSRSDKRTGKSVAEGTSPSNSVAEGQSPLKSVGKASSPSAGGKRKSYAVRTNDPVFIHQVHQRRVEGLAWVAIAREFDIPVMTVYDAWRRYVDKHQTELGEKIDDWKRIELDRLEKVISLAFEDYIKSRSPTITKTAKRKPGEDGGPDQVESSVKEESNVVGDPRYLAIINQSVAAQCRILGIGQSGVNVAVAVPSDQEQDESNAKPIFVVMTSEQDIAEMEEFRQLVRSAGYGSSKVIDGKLIEGAVNGRNEVEG